MTTNGLDFEAMRDQIAYDAIVKLVRNHCMQNQIEPDQLMSILVSIIGQFCKEMKIEGEDLVTFMGSVNETIAEIVQGNSRNPASKIMLLQ